MTKHLLGAIDEFPPGNGHEFVVAERIVALFRVGDDFFALDGICPHAGGPLGAGALEGTRLTCPWHGWQFDIATGRHCQTANIVQERFPVLVEDGEVFVELPE